MSFTMGLMPIERPKDGQSFSRSAHNSPMTSPLVSPAGSRRSSVTSVGSAYTDSGLDRFRQISTASSIDSTVSSKSAFRSLFGKKEKKPKEKKKEERIVLTSKHAAAVRNKLMNNDPRHTGSKSGVKTAGVVGTIKSGHLTAADQEARHPHSGPPALHASVADMPILTRIASADEVDEEDESEKNERLRMEYAASKQSAFARVAEHDSDESAQASAEVSADEDSAESATSPLEETLKPRRPVPYTKSSFGGRFHKDENGNWKR